MKALLKIAEQNAAAKNRPEVNNQATEASGKSSSTPKGKGASPVHQAMVARAASRKSIGDQEKADPTSREYKVVPPSG